MKACIVGVVAFAAGAVAGLSYRPPVPRVAFGLPAIQGYSVRASCQTYGGDWLTLDYNPGEPFEAGNTYHELDMPRGARIVLVEVHAPTPRASMNLDTRRGGDDE